MLMIVNELNNKSLYGSAFVDKVNPLFQKSDNHFRHFSKATETVSMVRI